MCFIWKVRLLLSGFGLVVLILSLSALGFSLRRARRVSLLLFRLYDFMNCYLYEDMPF